MATLPTFGAARQRHWPRPPPGPHSTGPTPPPGLAERNLIIGHSSRADIGISVYAKEGDLRKAVERTTKVPYKEIGGSLG